MSAESEAIDLIPIRDNTGDVVWATPDDARASKVNGVPVITVTTNGDLVDDHGDVLSQVPRDRMASGPNWDRIIRTIQEQETGKRGGDEVVVRPGGTLDLVPRGEAGQQLSQVPKDRMASAPRAVDEAELTRLDPNRVEAWIFIDDPVLPGYTFTMRPVSTAFQFFTFRWNSGRWYLSPLAPVFDTLLGHETHVISLSVGGDSVPIVCKAPNEFDHRNLTEVRGTAGKFATYHSLRASGHVPYSA